MMAPYPTPGRCSPQPGIEPGLRSLLARFSYLQLLDLLTTLVFLANGVQEANPFVRLAIAAAHSKLAGLVEINSIALAFAAYCAVTGRRRLLGRMNLFFGALIVWNLLALLAT
jgi:hypothetical protein